MINIIIAPGKNSLAKLASEFILNQAKISILRAGVCNIALSGGSTPKDIFRATANHPDSKSIDWGNVNFFWSDERPVSPSHPDSNFNMALETLLSPLEIQQKNIFRIQGELSPQLAAKNYEIQISNMLGEFPKFDLVLLGIGEDGHTASLFPNTKGLEVTNQLVVANWVEQHNSWRITFTLSLINQARHVVFLVSGRNKSKILHEIIERRTAYPATRIKPSNGVITWLLDQAAARYLSNNDNTRSISQNE